MQLGNHHHRVGLRELKVVTVCIQQRQPQKALPRLMENRGGNGNLWDRLLPRAPQSPLRQGTPEDQVRGLESQDDQRSAAPPAERHQHRSWQERVRRERGQPVLAILEEQSSERGHVRPLLWRGVRSPVVGPHPAPVTTHCPGGEETSCDQQRRKGLIKTKPHQSVEHATPDLRVVISSPTLCVEIT